MAKLDIVQCQGCHGYGGETDVTLADGTGPWEKCGYCQGTGQTTRMMNGWIMRWARHLSWVPSAMDEYTHSRVMTDARRRGRLQAA